MPYGISERPLTRIWQYQWLDGTRLVTEDRQQVTVLYPGRLNDDHGPDFTDAVVLLDDRRLTGDIEIHVTSADWESHGHDRDAAYDTVILHVVMRHDVRRPTKTSNGRSVPVLALQKYVRAPASVWWYDQDGAMEAHDRPCRNAAGKLGESSLGRFLDAAGDARFQWRSTAFGEQMQGSDSGQVLYQGIMEALGYSRNKAPFVELSRRLPLQVLEAAVLREGNQTDEQCQAYSRVLLMGLAGLAPEVRPHLANCTIRACATAPCWEKLLPRGYQARPLSETDWHLFRVRPNNTPAFRLQAMGYFLGRFRRHGFFRGLLDVVREAPWDSAASGLVQAVMAPGVGRDRAADIIVNVLLPFAHAYGQATGQEGLSSHSLDLYRRCGRLEPNSVERHMSAQLGLPGASRAIVNSARRQQGLIHLYRTLCVQGLCHRCYPRLGVTSV